MIKKNIKRPNRNQSFIFVYNVSRLLLNEVWKEYEIQKAEEEYILEKQSAARELEDKKIELQENLISELEEKKRIVETERITIELTGDSMEVYAFFIFERQGLYYNLNVIPFPL